MRSKPQSEQEKSPSHRALMVMSAIGEHGPITLSGLCALLPVPRTAIWRATATLRDFGWVRIRLADKAFELTSQCDLMLSRSHFSHPATDLAAATLDELRKEGVVAADAGMFTTAGRFSLIESTRADADLGVPLSLLNDKFALAAQAAMPPDELLRHLRAFQRIADPMERELVSSGAHARAIMALTRSQRAGLSPVPKMIPVGKELLFVAPHDVGDD